MRIVQPVERVICRVQSAEMVELLDQDFVEDEADAAVGVPYRCYLDILIYMIRIPEDDPLS